MLLVVPYKYTWKSKFSENWSKQRLAWWTSRFKSSKRLVSGKLHLEIYDSFSGGLGYVQREPRRHKMKVALGKAAFNVHCTACSHNDRQHSVSRVSSSRQHEKHKQSPRAFDMISIRWLNAVIWQKIPRREIPFQASADHVSSLHLNNFSQHFLCFRYSIERFKETRAFCLERERRSVLRQHVLLRD